MNKKNDDCESEEITDVTEMNIRPLHIISGWNTFITVFIQITQVTIKIFYLTRLDVPGPQTFQDCEQCLHITSSTTPNLGIPIPPTVGGICLDAPALRRYTFRI
jgi:hypothetical protein